MRFLFLLILAFASANSCLAGLTFSIGTVHSDGTVSTDGTGLVSVVNNNVYRQKFTATADNVDFDATLIVTASRAGSEVVIGDSNGFGFGAAATGNGFGDGLGITTTNPQQGANVEVSSRVNNGEEFSFQVTIDSFDASQSAFTDVEFLGFNQILLREFLDGEEANLTLDSGSSSVSGSNGMGDFSESFGASQILEIAGAEGLGDENGESGFTNFTVSGLSLMFQGIGFTAVPEPSSLALLLGLVPFVAGRRRRSTTT